MLGHRERSIKLKGPKRLFDHSGINQDIKVKRNSKKPECLQLKYRISNNQLNKGETKMAIRNILN